jgi:hypothetical protein
MVQKFVSGDYTLEVAPCEGQATITDDELRAPTKTDSSQIWQELVGRFNACNETIPLHLRQMAKGVQTEQMDSTRTHSRQQTPEINNFPVIAFTSQQ